MTGTKGASPRMAGDSSPKRSSIPQTSSLTRRALLNDRFLLYNVFVKHILKAHGCTQRSGTYFTLSAPQPPCIFRYMINDAMHIYDNVLMRISMLLPALLMFQPAWRLSTDIYIYIILIYSKIKHSTKQRDRGPAAIDLLIDSNEIWKAPRNLVLSWVMFQNSRRPPLTFIRGAHGVRSRKCTFVQTICCTMYDLRSSDSTMLQSKEGGLTEGNTGPPSVPTESQITTRTQHTPRGR